MRIGVMVTCLAHVQYIGVRFLYPHKASPQNINVKPTAGCRVQKRGLNVKFALQRSKGAKEQRSKAVGTSIV